MNYIDTTHRDVIIDGREPRSSQGIAPTIQGLLHRLKTLGDRAVMAAAERQLNGGGRRSRARLFGRSCAWMMRMRGSTDTGICTCINEHEQREEHTGELPHMT